MYNLSYSKGITFQMTEDIFAFNLLGIGSGYGKNNIFLYGKNEVGLIIYEIFKMKSTIENNTYYNTYRENNILNEFKITQSLKLTKNVRVDFSYTNTRVKSQDNEKVAFMLNYIF